MRPTTKEASMPTTTSNNKYLGLTEDEFHRFSRACNATWQAIGGDLLDAVLDGPANEYGHKAGGIPRADVVETVLDAGHLLTYGEPGGGRPRPTLKLGTPQGDQFGTRPAWPVFYETRLNPWVRQHYFTPKFKRLMKEVFPYASYGY
jgi:hypothetical protein